MNIQDYIKGSKKGKEAKDFEEKLMRDPFLAEAMEGYEKVKGNHDIIIARLRQKVAKKTSRKKFRHPMFIWSSIAAAVAVIAIVAIFFLGGFHLYFHNRKQLSVVADSMVLTPNIVVADSVASTSEPADAKKSDSSKIESEANLSGKKLIAKAIPVLSSSGNQKRKPQTKERIFAASATKRRIADTTSYVVNYNTSLPKQANAELMNVTGFVKDEKGSPMIGVKVNTENFQEVYTDSQGKFSLKNIQKGQKIIFSYIGFKTKELAPEEAKTNQILTVTMAEDNVCLAEQVIINKDQWKKSKKNKQKATPVTGFNAYQKYIEKNKQISSDKDCKGKTGKIKVIFSTDKNGRPYNIRVVQCLCPEYDRQAIGLINNGEAWTANCKGVTYEIKF